MAHVDLRRVFPIDQPTFSGARWLLALGLAGVLVAFFWVCGVFSHLGESRTGDGVDPPWAAALFFTAILAYIIPTFGFISERTVDAIDALRPALSATPEQIDTWRARVYRKPVRWLVVVLTVALTSGTLHNLLLYGSFSALWQQGLGSQPGFAIVAGTGLTWLFVTIVVAALLDNAGLLAGLAGHVQVRLLDPLRLRPFATVAVISTLAIIGAQAAFPIMNLDGEIPAAAYIPGLLATGVPMLLLAARPVWPVHRRIAAAKREALARVQEEIDALAPPGQAVPADLSTLAPLLTYRRELQAAPEWPFDLGVMARLAFYLIIPPLTWVGAALIENVVNAVL
jgi:hypothetical protein